VSTPQAGNARPFGISIAAMSLSFQARKIKKGSLRVFNKKALFAGAEFPLKEPAAALWEGFLEMLTNNRWPLFTHGEGCSL
jgi:hypothetical protein